MIEIYRERGWKQKLKMVSGLKSQLMRISLGAETALKSSSFTCCSLRKFKKKKTKKGQRCELGDVSKFLSGHPFRAPSMVRNWVGLSDTLF